MSPDGSLLYVTVQATSSVKCNLFYAPLSKYVTISHSRAYTAQEIASSARISGNELAKTVMLRIGPKMAMLVLAASYRLDFGLLKRAIGFDEVRLADRRGVQRPLCRLRGRGNAAVWEPLGVGHLCSRESDILNFEIVYWVENPDYNVYVVIQQAINLAIFGRFAEQGIEFAYPSNCYT
jgi:hypothetical protein